MIKMLQKKFVITAMIAVSALIFLLLGAVNVINIVIVQGEVDRTLSMIVENGGNPGNAFPVQDAAPPGFMDAPKSDYDTLMSSNYFIVRLNRDGQSVFVDVSRTSAVTEEEAEAIAEELYSSGKDSGKTGKFRYLVQADRVGNGTTAVFLDTSEERYSYLRVLLLSVSIGLICWGLMLMLVILLSRKAIRPIAENFEKQKQFVTNAGHEIKTPLAIIQSNIEAMELYNGENKWSKNIKTQTIRLSGLMNQLLMLSRMDENAEKVRCSDFCVSQILTDVLQDFLQPAEEKGVVLHTDIQQDVILHADQSQIEQLCSILLDNAVKYTDDGGQIWIRLTREGKRMKMQFQNTCESLPDAAPDKLFERFYRADTARTQKSGGYGIGLSIAHTIVEANKGKIQAKYTDPDCITFLVSL